MERAYYPVSELYLFPLYTRESYEKEFGKQAPPFNPDYRIKRWFDAGLVSLAKDNPLHEVEYIHLDHQSGKVQKFTLTAYEASRVNLPGLYRYEKYEVEPTTAVVVGPRGSMPQTLNPEILSYKEQADALAAELGAVEVVEGKAAEDSPFVRLWGTERRREYYVVINGSPYNVGALLKAKNAYGVGAPGKWIITQSGPVWVPLPQADGLSYARPEVPIPIRPLLPNEAVSLNPFGAPVVYRTDLESPFNKSMSFESKVLAALGRIEQILREKIR